MPKEQTKDDPLRSLLVDAAEVDRQAIAEVLAGRVAIDGKTGRTVLAPGYATLDSARKVLTILVARKAAHLLDLIESEATSNTEIVRLSGLPPGTAAPNLKRFRELHLVGQDDKKAYYVPNAQLREVIDYIVKGREA